MMKYLLLVLIAANSLLCSGQTTTHVYDFVEEMPKFPGGEDSLWRFIKANLTYPEKEKQDSIQGKVIVGFVLNEEGIVTYPETKRGVSPGLDTEAIRLVSLLPKFTPGRQQGKAVKVKYVLPIVFKLGYKTVLPLPSTIEMVVINGSSNLSDYKLGFVNGDSAFAALVIKNLLYPKKERESRIAGKTIITCEVNTDGSLDTLYIASSSGNKALDDEAWRVVKLAAKFQPTYMNGKAIPVAFNVPIKFIAPKDEYYRVPLLKASDDTKQPHTNNLNIADSTAEGMVFRFVDQQPEFPGGEIELIKFLQKNIKYPTDDVEGKVMIRFILDETGSVTNVKVIRGVSDKLDAEAIRVVSLLPNFKPGIEDGKPVKVYFTLPVVFRLQH